MGEDVRSMMESAGTGNPFPIPENDENADVPADEDIPLTKGAGPSTEPSPSFFMNREEPQEEGEGSAEGPAAPLVKGMSCPQGHQDSRHFQG